MTDPIADMLSRIRNGLQAGRDAVTVPGSKIKRAILERMLEEDFAHSRLMAPGEFDARPWWFRFAVKLARLTAPVQ